MKFTVYKRDTGQVLFSGDGQNPEVFENEEQAVALGVKRDAGWIDAVGNHHALPERPSVFHEWDWSSKQWADARPIEMILAQKVVQVHQERDRRINAPIEYLGRMVDANPRAQSNITNKINEINARVQTGQAMPENLMIWLDAENQTVRFDSQGQMRDWLQGLVIAITQRGTEAYAWSWQVKDQLRALESKDAIEAFSW